MNSKAIVTVLAICGAFLVAVVVSCAGVFFLTFRNMDSEISPIVDELFAAIDNDCFAETYNTCTALELREAVTREQYEAVGVVVRARLGHLKSKSLSQFNVRQFAERRYGKESRHSAPA